jgi:3-phosphoshikimate 1-carboxyvinyltransferase
MAQKFSGHLCSVKRLRIQRLNEVIATPKGLPASKSISNRVLILDALAEGGSTLEHLSTARDTQLMQSLLKSDSEILDVQDAGTTMRFLTAYCGALGRPALLTGSARMKERPLGPLTDALTEIGVELSFPERAGFPPVQIHSFPGQAASRVKVRGDISSQFISALMMIAPRLPEGLEIELTGKVGSEPYIGMTGELMRKFGAPWTREGPVIRVSPGLYRPLQFRVESDWSAASYWFGFVALAQSANVTLSGLEKPSLQGDSVIEPLMAGLGVRSQWVDGELILTREPSQSSLTYDFTHCPDLFQTVAVVCAAGGIQGEFTGLESLRIKETDRIAALQNELAKLGATLAETGSRWKLEPPGSLPGRVSVSTYDDHRMAMAFAPLATRMDVEIENPEVVAKSYPDFWTDVGAAGFRLDRE